MKLNRLTVNYPNLGSGIESICQLDGRVEQINGHPAMALTTKPVPTHDRTDLIPIP
ncbi:MAG: hypothetical protein HC827_21535 [Cyanobacteria bacterium RM1_2_2]|nr:hypothetical protein [Cyanobacteria bacterium RM1_2_2]